MILLLAPRSAFILQYLDGQWKKNSTIKLANYKKVE